MDGAGDLAAEAMAEHRLRVERRAGERRDGGEREQPTRRPAAVVVEQCAEDRHEEHERDALQGPVGDDERDLRAQEPAARRVEQVVQLADHAVAPVARSCARHMPA